MSLYDLIAFAIMAHIVFDGTYKKAYKLFIEEIKLFQKVRYNKIVERLNRYEKLLIECLKLFKLEGKIIVDSKSLETKKLARFNRHKKIGKSKIIRDEESIGFNTIKKGFYVGYKITCATHGKYLKILYIDREFENEMKNRGIEYITIKRENMRKNTIDSYQG
jgi:hypothetical protein